MSQSDDEGEQTIVINDLLSFVWCKLKLCNEEKLLKCIADYYSKEEAVQALKTLLTALPSDIKSSPGYKQSRDDPFTSILNILKDYSSEQLPTFVCKNLNNVPKLDIANHEPKQLLTDKKKQFYKEHQQIKSQLSDVFNSLYELKKQFQALSHEKANCVPCENENEELVVPKKSKAKRRKPPGKKDLSYLQNLIDEEGNSELKDLLDEFDGEADDDTVLEQRINLIANRRQRASFRAYKVKAEKPLQQKVIQIEKDGHTHVTDSPDFTRDSENSSPVFEVNDHLEVTLSNDSANKNCRFVCVEHHFDGTIGAFKLYRCSDCSFCSNSEAKVLEHACIRVSYEKKKTGKLRFQPPQKDVVKKETRKYKRQKFPCHKCGVEFRLRISLTKHLEDHLGGGHKCPLCEDRFTEEEWLPHVRGCPGSGSTKFEDHYCDVCDVFYADKRTLGFHKAFHDPSRPFECIECKFRFYSQKTVEDHFRTHRIQENCRKCPFCEFRTKKAHKVVDHIRCHTGDKPFKCPKCERCCPNYKSLQVHLTSHSLTRDFLCDICGKGFKSANKVAAHRKIHTVERPHKCPICGKGFKIGLQMVLHHRMHLDVRKHACKLCPYKARTAAVLRGHMNTHTNNKPFKCHKCDFGANHKSYLNWHLRYNHMQGKVEPCEMEEEEIR